jgi:uncharacterized damage-inducible protein DinB
MELKTPEELSAVVGRGLAQYYERVRDKVHGLVAPLSTDQLWQRPFPYGNSIGHLLLHLTGNLRYYIGARIADSGYVRDRPREFTDDQRRPKDEVLREFDDAVDTVLAALGAQTWADWGAAYEAVGENHAADRFAIFVSCVAHADHHVGQMIYLCKQLALAGTAA